MKIKYLLIPIASLGLLACEQKKEVKTEQTNAVETTSVQPAHASEVDTDRVIINKIRQMITTNGTFSEDAKKIRIVSHHGQVTLKGPVASENEKREIDKRVRLVEGVMSVNNQLKVK